VCWHKRGQKAGHPLRSPFFLIRFTRRFPSLPPSQASWSRCSSCGRCRWSSAASRPATMGASTSRRRWGSRCRVRGL